MNMTFYLLDSPLYLDLQFSVFLLQLHDLGLQIRDFVPEVYLLLVEIFYGLHLIYVFLYSLELFLQM